MRRGEGRGEGKAYRREGGGECRRRRGDGRRRRRGGNCRVRCAAPPSRHLVPPSHHLALLPRRLARCQLCLSRAAPPRLADLGVKRPFWPNFHSEPTQTEHQFFVGPGFETG
jgi:hypothetical protein